MSYLEALQALETMISDARGVPLSASAVIPREEALKLVKEVMETMPAEHEQAREIVHERERILSEAHEKASFIVKEAREERTQMLRREDVVQAAEREAKRIVEEATAKANHLAHQADDYVDAKLANFEILLSKLLRTTGKGREQMRRKLEAALGEVEPLELDDSGEFSGPMQQIQPE